jgi:hypothetical protein
VPTLNLLPLGHLTMTRGVAHRFVDPSPLLTILARHASGDWGVVGAADARANDEALTDGTRVLSVYVVDGVRLWVITEADRSSTTILLPEEY